MERILSKFVLIFLIFLGSFLLVKSASAHPYISDLGTLLEDFETIGDWTVAGTAGATQEATTNVKQGNFALQLNAVNGGTAFSTKTISLDLSEATNFTLWVHIDDVAKLNYISTFFSSTTDWSKYFILNIWDTNFHSGWNKIVFNKSDYTNTASDSWSNTMIRMRVRCAASGTDDVSVIFDDFRKDYNAEPKVIITFDDGDGSHIDKAYPIMTGNGQAGVSFVVTSLIDTGAYMTLANLQTLQSAGWDVSNHTKTHPDLTSLSEAEMHTEIDDADLYLTNFDSKRFFAYPGGKYNDTIIDYLAQEGFIFARTILYGEYQPHLDLVDNNIQYQVKSKVVINTTTVQSVKDRIDRLVTQKGLLVLVFHVIVDADADAETKYLTADFEEISDYLKTKQDADLLEVITFSDYYNALDTPADPVLQSTSHPSETTWYSNATPDISLSSATSSNHHYHYLVNQTASPSKSDVEAGTEDSDGTFTVPADTISSDGTWYVHLIAQNLINYSSTNFDTYTIKYYAGGGIYIERTTTINSDNSIIYSTDPTSTDTKVTMTITPSSGSVDVTINTWNTSGTYYKKWTESATGTLSVEHTVGDLKANTYYTVKVDGSKYNTYLSNSSGEISFTYTGEYSDHEFEVEEYTTDLTIPRPPGSRRIKEEPISEMTVEELKAKITEILAKITQLKVQLQQLLEKEVSEIPTDYRFTADLKYNQRGDNVRYLQIFFKAQGLEIYPEGIVSGWFGPLTKKAVIRFQETYADDILASWRLIKGTGFVGQTTRTKINEILGR